MADITLTATAIAPYMVEECQIRSRTLAATVTAGQPVYYDTNGKANPTDADSGTGRAHNFDGIALDAGAAGNTVRVLEEGWVYGYDLSGVAYNDPVFLSATAGTLATTTTASGVQVGKCDWRNDAGGTFTKVLRVDRRPGGSQSGTVKTGSLAVGGAALHAANLAWTNPEAGSINIIRAVLVISTASTGASTIDIGTTATSATTSSDKLIDGVSGATAGSFDNITNAGTNGKSTQRLAAGKWVTLDEASGDVTGMVATLYVQYIPD
jgi:hypothetical protein